MRKVSVGCAATALGFVILSWGVAGCSDRGRTGHDEQGDTAVPLSVFPLERRGGMVRIQAAGTSFIRGSDDGYKGERPSHTVTLTEDFWIDTTEVTQQDYDAAMGVNPAQFSDDPARPVERVTWFDAVLYCNARSKREGFDTVYTYSAMVGLAGNGCSDLQNLAHDFSKNGYRLPTEAQWEYACRAGTTTELYWGDPELSHLFAWYSARTHEFDRLDSTFPVARKFPNAFGLYDMSGNVWEWVHDWYGIYSGDAVVDPAGPSQGPGRIVKGGSWDYNNARLRSAVRYYTAPHGSNSSTGFRVVRPAREPRGGDVEEE